MLDHVAFEVADIARSARFYDALMHPLGGRRIVDSPDGIGYGRDRPEVWIMAGSRSPTAVEPSRTHAATSARPSARPPAASRAQPPAASPPQPTAGPLTASPAAPVARSHIAIVAAGRRAVDAAHEAGIAAGGRDAGAPAARPFGPPSYYSGYLVDPDGARIELVTGSR